MHGRKPLRKMERAYRTRNAFYGSPFLLPEVCLVRCISDRKQFSDRILKINFFLKLFVRLYGLIVRKEEKGGCFHERCR